MKVLVLNTMVPFLRGGAEALAEQLVRSLNGTHGVQAELVRIPFKWEPAERLIEEILICRSMRLYGTDVMIGLTFPAYLVPHDRKRLWLMHQYRQAYDLWDAGQSSIPNTPRGREIRKAVIEADNRCFRDCEKIFATRLVAHRLRHYNNVDSEIMMAPLNDPELFVGGDYGSYIFCGGRINAAKRQHLLVEAMRFTRSNVKLVVAGGTDTRGRGARPRPTRSRLGMLCDQEADDGAHRLEQHRGEFPPLHGLRGSRLLLDLRHGRPIGCCDDLDLGDAYFVWGSNFAEMHAILYSRIVERKHPDPGGTFL